MLGLHLQTLVGCRIWGSQRCSLLDHCWSGPGSLRPISRKPFKQLWKQPDSSVSLKQKGRKMIIRPWTKAAPAYLNPTSDANGLSQGTTSRCVITSDDHTASQSMLILLTPKNKREKKKWRAIHFHHQSAVPSLPLDVALWWSHTVGRVAFRKFGLKMSLHSPKGGASCEQDNWLGSTVNHRLRLAQLLRYLDEFLPKQGSSGEFPPLHLWSYN